MITRLELRNFKIHREVQMDFKALTLISGKNSAGKSSIIQSLLLLRQSWRRDPSLDRLQLNGELYDCGFAQDALNQASDEDWLQISLNSSSGFFTRRYSKENQSGNQDVLFNFGDATEGSPRGDDALFSNRFQYISAFRWPPRDSYPLDSTTVVADRQISKEKGQCEYIAHFLDYYGKSSQRYSVPKELWHPNCDSDNLVEQASFWEQEISPRVRVHTEQQGLGYLLRYSYTREDGLSSNEYSAINVGFGLSFVLPIIVAILASEKDSLLIIENPEAHLHQEAQVALMELITRAANFGIQIVVETHSDYILNGVLLGVKRSRITPEKVSLFHFDKDENTQSSSCTTVRIREDGGLESQPKGFFDQAQVDLSALLGF